MTAPDGLLVVDKPPDWTSHDVVARCRRLAGTRRVGHAGTLDPMATGVLVLGIGRATRLLGYLSLTSKGYDATIRLGAATVTDDAQGDVVATLDATGVKGPAIQAAVAALTGEIMQVPSAVSAIKVKGERAYKRVRDGEAVELAPRPVVITEFDVTDVRRSGQVIDLDCHIECSTGTYVRALARDLGAALEVGGHLTALRRTRVGRHVLEHAHGIDELAELESEQLPVEGLSDVARRSFTAYVVSEEQVPAVRNGRAIQVRLRPETTAGSSESAAGPVAVLTPAGEFLALYEQHGPVAQAVAVFAPA